MLVVVTNNKGGQGKTFISALLALCLMKNPDNKGKVVCCDRNLAQQNLAQLLKNTDIPVVFDDPLKVSDSRLWIVDTSPNIFENIELIKKADVLVVPVSKGIYSLHGLQRIHEIKGDNKNIKVILNEWSATSAQKKVAEILEQEGYNVIGKLPLYQRVMNNLEGYLAWDYGLTKPQAYGVFDVMMEILK